MSFKKTALCVVYLINERHASVVYSRYAVVSIKTHISFEQIYNSNYVMIPLHSQYGPDSPTHLSYQISYNITHDATAIKAKSQDFEILPFKRMMRNNMHRPIFKIKFYLIEFAPIIEFNLGYTVSCHYARVWRCKCEGPKRIHIVYKNDFEKVMHA